MKTVVFSSECRMHMTIACLVMAACVLPAADGWHIASQAVHRMDPNPVSDASGYAIAVTNGGAGQERRCYADGHHFLSLLNEGGILACRPHPGVDLNGWGSTLYLQPFFPGAVLRGATIAACTPGPTGIDLTATGTVSLGTSETFGSWQVSLHWAYDGTGKRITGSGDYAIQLAGQLSESTGDLNLAKLASNYLDGVPLVDGSTNDTGDMAFAHVWAGTLDTIWIPPHESGYYPDNQTSNLIVDVTGAFNQIDTAAQGYHAIQAAFKPSVKLVLTSADPVIPMTFGGSYDTGKAQDFTADNVGITPLVLTSSPSTQFTFSVAIESAALSGDGIGIICDLTATGALPASTAEVYYTDSLSRPFRRYVGDLNLTAPTACTGTVAVPFPPTQPRPSSGFLRLKTNP